jgi:hypothetical protein
MSLPFILYLAGCFFFVIIAETIAEDELGDNTLLAPAWPILLVGFVFLFLHKTISEYLMSKKKKAKALKEKKYEPLESHEDWVKRTGIKIDVRPPKKAVAKKRKR